MLRHQFVSLNNTHATIRLNDYGVTQGSSLVPLLFLLYVNDLSNAFQSIPRLFADDTCLLLTHSNPLTLQEKLNQEVSLLCNWCNSNKLTINTEKCHLIIITFKICSKDFSVTLNNSPITLKNHVKYLGVFIDSKLNFHFHLNVVANKLSRALGIPSKLKHVLPQNALFKLYYSLFYPHLLYGLVAWGSTFPTYLHKFASIQNKAVKLIGGGHFLESSTHFYAKLKILKILDLYIFETSKLVHDYMNRKLPLSFSDYFNKSCDVSNCSTRTSKNWYNLYKPLYHNNRMQKSIKY